MPYLTSDFSYVLGMTAVFAFSVTAVLAVLPKGTDVFSACVLGLITAVGGGTIRDVILDVPVFWAKDTTYLWVSLIASLLTFWAYRWMSHRRIHLPMLYIDGLGASLFAIQAAQKVIDLDFGMPLAPIILGVTTAIGGGLFRDMLAGSPTLLMTPELYAIPITFGCIVYVVAVGLFPNQTVVVSLICIMMIFAIRASAIHWNISVPSWMKAKLG